MSVSTDRPSSPASSASARPVFRDVPYMGVIFVVAEAVKRGFVNGHPDWCNLGQGQPEVGPMAGAPPRIESVTLDPSDHAYGPLEGLPELREAVAAHYNRLFRQGHASRYGPENVAVANGGRLSLSRALAALGPITIGYQLPDYTAYEDMLDVHLARVTPVSLRTAEADGFRVTPAQVERAIVDAGLSAFLVSNPCNPTGQVLAGDELARLVALSREHGCTMLLDEFYSHFVYVPEPGGPAGRGAAAGGAASGGSAGVGRPWHAGAGPVSGAAFVEDVERDPVILFDGLTKSFRYPGWRVGWVVGPSHLVETVARVASALDGGPSRIAQRAAIDALAPAAADQETTALRDVFVEKRNVMVQRLSDMGVRFAAEPDSTFYAWGSLADLPEPLNDAMTFFWRALDRQVMTVPGQFFDVNPGRRRPGPSPYAQWMRFSFGPPMDNMVLGLDRLAEMVREA